MYIELSRTLKGEMPIYPDSVSEEMEPVLRTEDGDVSNTSIMHHYTHNGTHIDSPFHFDGEGEKIDGLDINNFIYENPEFIFVEKEPGEKITLSEIKEKNLENADLLIIRTGFDKAREDDPINYRFNFPALTKKLARYLREELDIKAIMIDFLSVDGLIEGNQNGFPVHKQLLHSETSDKKPVLIIEDVNLFPLMNKEIERVFALPVRFENADGAPVSIVAEVR